MSNTYVRAKLFTEDEIENSIQSQKQGHKCCGGCCDMRRAVIIVNIVSMIFSLLGVAFMGLGFELLKTASDALDDDQVKQSGGDAMQNLPMGAIVAGMLISLASYVLGIMGAISFTPWQVMVATACYGIHFVFQVMTVNIMGMIFTGFFAYPHVFFILEMKNNIMTPENYHNEVQSCCCV
jgi:hypothetical protein